jgi:Helix-turn-helix domain of resolvase
MGKVAGVYKGRPPSIEAARVRELKAQGMRPTDIAKALKIGRASVYRLLESWPQPLAWLHRGNFGQLAGVDREGRSRVMRIAGLVPMSHFSHKTVTVKPARPSCT